MVASCGQIGVPLAGPVVVSVAAGWVGSKARIFKIRFWDAIFSRFDRAFQNTLNFREQSLCSHQFVFAASAFEKPCSNLFEMLVASCHIVVWMPPAVARPANAIPSLGFRCPRSSDTCCPSGLRPHAGPSSGRGPPLSLGRAGGHRHTDIALKTCRQIDVFPISF